MFHLFSVSKDTTKKLKNSSTGDKDKKKQLN